ncbi:MAG: ACT domain-containing protein, partial [Alicyclobacillus sp.]|nr:ACT domain-containing protein [Alicyclobacillus sp.]
STEQRAFLDPYLTLGEQLGLFLAQWADGDVQALEVSYGGPLTDHNVAFVTRTILKGLFGYRYGDEVNYVNAPVLAEQSGLTIREIKQPKSRVFTNLVTLTAKVGSETFRLSGTLYNGFGPRIVEIDGYAVDAPPDGYMLLTKHEDKPGMIGRIGTLLGDLHINIAAMQVGRKESGGEAVMVLSVDKEVPQSVVAQIAAMKGIRVVRSVNLTTERGL